MCGGHLLHPFAYAYRQLLFSAHRLRNFNLGHGRVRQAAVGEYPHLLPVYFDAGISSELRTIDHIDPVGCSLPCFHAVAEPLVGFAPMATFIVADARLLGLHGMVALGLLLAAHDLVGGDGVVGGSLYIL